MLELFSDPSTIPFVRNDQVNLPLLKSQIDRRIAKITAMIQGRRTHLTHLSRHFSPQSIELNKFVQTDNTPILVNSLITYNSQEDRALCPSNKFNPNLDPTQQLNDPKAMTNSLKRERKSSMAESQAPKQRKHRNPQPAYLRQEPPIVESNGFTFRGNEDSHTSTYRRHLQQSHNSKIFEEAEYPIDFSSVPMCNSVTEGQFRHTNTLSPFTHIDNVRNSAVISLFTDLSSSNRTKNELSQRRRFPYKPKYQEKDIILPQPIRRYVVESSCLQRMKTQGESLVNRRRKELWDNKIRMNLLKKIEQRYNGQLYDA